MKYMIVVLTGIALTACSATVPARGVVTSAASPPAAFVGYKTFSFGLSNPPRTGYDVTSRSLEVQRRLRPVVLTALQARGYKEDESGGDFVVKLASGTGQEQMYGSDRTLHTTARGFIGIDIYDASTGAEVWQSAAFAEIDPVQIDDSLLQAGVTHMLASVPARDAVVATAP